MKLFGHDCGCDARREVIFDAGDIGAPEAALLVAGLLAVAIAYYIARGK